MVYLSALISDNFWCNNSLFTVRTSCLLGSQQKGEGTYLLSLFLLNNKWLNLPNFYYISPFLSFFICNPCYLIFFQLGLHQQQFIKNCSIRPLQTSCFMRTLTSEICSLIHLWTCSRGNLIVLKCSVGSSLHIM